MLHLVPEHERERHDEPDQDNRRDEEADAGARSLAVASDACTTRRPVRSICAVDRGRRVDGRIVGGLGNAAAGSLGHPGSLDGTLADDRFAHTSNRYEKWPEVYSIERR